ncbi:MFS transporter [uncultured Algimonas sp.]|uniref:spinster family MFS transporter n=1 Tax=uncultured Algimonas sp. TaxID=1547920 RepID=UPI002603C1D7|nr:MFS transporter [uncultured Algimonas sp.]
MVLLLLTLVYGFNFIDRQIVGILAPFIQADLGLTNTQLGLLIGLAFAAFYTIMGIPLAFLADRMNRVTLLALALATWSGFTAITGFAQNFMHIALARVGVGVGEAGGSPPSHSMISDFYGKEERAGALGIYSLGIPLGIMSAYFLTAALIGADPNTVDWRRIFIILGVAGIALAVVVKLVIREPMRGAMENNVSKTSGYISIREAMARSRMMPRYIVFGFLIGLVLTLTLMGVVAWLIAVIASLLFTTLFLLSIQPGVLTIISIKSWWWMALGIAFASFAGYAVAGFQTKFLRLLDPEYNFRTIIIWIGIINGTLYVAGTYFGAKLVDWKAKKDIRAYGSIPAISLAIAFPLAILTFWAPTVELHLIFGAGLQLCLGVYLGPSFAIAQTLAPIALRAMSTALFFFVLNMIALGGGPTFAGFMIDVFMERGNDELSATRLAMYWTFGAMLLAIFFYSLVRITLPKDWAAAEARNSAGS